MKNFIYITSLFWAFQMPIYSQYILKDSETVVSKGILCSLTLDETDDESTLKGKYIIIPSILHNDTIIAIGKGFASDNEALNGCTIELPNTLRYIMNDAFSNIFLKAIILPENLIKIGDNAFCNGNLTEVNFSNSLKYIGRNSFRNNIIKEVVFTKDISFIGIGAFSDNQGLVISNLARPYKVNHLFYKWNNEISLTSLNKDDCYPIYYYNDTIYYELKIEDISNSSNTIEYCHYRGSTNIFIPSKIDIFKFEEIGLGCFSQNGFEKIIISKGIKRIGAFSFSNNNLSSVNLCPDIEFIGNFAFSNNKLKNFELPQKITTINKGAFESNFLNHIYIPNNIDTIKERAFNNNKLEKVEFPKSLVYIGKNAFSNNCFKPNTQPRLPLPYLPNNEFLYWYSFSKSDKVTIDHSNSSAPIRKRKITFTSKCQPGDLIEDNYYYMAIFKDTVLPEYENE